MINKKQVLMTSLGNTFEWFDFGLFVFMAPIIGEKFFPANTPIIATLQAFMVFAAGFICRPLGGIFFGHLGDTQGRAKTLRLSVLIVAFSTLCIGLLPTYAEAGFFATALFIGLRLVQGLSIGGEYSGVMIYLAESALPDRRGFVTSFAATGANLGFLLATLTLILLTTFFSKKAIFDWGWRIPFVLTGLPGWLILYYRFKLAETNTYLTLEKTHHIEAQPFFAAIKQAPLQLLKILGLTCMSSSLYYVFFGLMPFYLERYIGVSTKMALGLQSSLLIAMLFLVPFAGWCGDYFSRKRLLIMTACATILFALPCFYLFQMHSLFSVALALSIAMILSSFDQGNSVTAVVENCPANVRYSGIAFSYNLGMALFGGSAPLVVTLLTDQIGLLAPAYYLILMASISLLAALTLLKSNKIMGFL